jgi:hypothetical protein
VPYLSGKSSYPPADPSVGGGLMSSMSWIYPTGPINIQQNLQPLSDTSDNVIPGLNGWRFIHTPGHAPGHISLFRESDKVLIAGDAVVTTQQESALHALTYKKQLSGPPKYLTCNWASAKISVLKLAALDPQIIATGHGEPMQGEQMQLALQRLSTRFDKLAQPAHGRYVNEPAITDETGVVYLPPAVESDYSTTLKVVGISLAVLSIGYLIYRQVKKKSEPKNTVNDLLAGWREKPRHKLHHLLN